jgi:hypothetical protein
MNGVQRKNQSEFLQQSQEKPNVDHHRNVNALWLEGTNVLHEKREQLSSAWFRQDLSLDPERLREVISEELVIPKHLLTVTADFPETARTRFVIPYPLTMRRDE